MIKYFIQKQSCFLSQHQVCIIYFTMNKLFVLQSHFYLVFGFKFYTKIFVLAYFYTFSLKGEMTFNLKNLE